MEFIVNNLPIIICALIGIFLLIVETFMPGFGVPGFSGIALLGAAVYLTWKEYGSLAGLGVALTVLALACLAVTLSIRFAASGRFAKSALVLGGSSSKEEGYRTSDDKNDYLHLRGEALTVLRPSGIALIRGERTNVVTTGAFIEKGAKIVVTDVEGGKVVVEECLEE